MLHSGRASEVFNPHTRWHKSFVHRLVLDRAIENIHRGCVNCLSWNETGTRLVSGSDDTKIAIIPYDSPSAPFVFQSGHAANIFGIKFLPESGDSVIVSGAWDQQVCLHRLQQGSSEPHISNYHCHAARVKEVAVEAGNPCLFWSAGEDGTVRQFDIRQPHICRNGRRNGSLTPSDSSGGCSNVLLSVKQHSCGSRMRHKAIKSITINPVFTNYMAVAASDAVVRIYDRRMMSIGSDSSAEPLKSFAPPHLSKHYFTADGQLPFAPVSSTHVIFNGSGREVLVNYSGEHMYLFGLFDTSVDNISYRAPIPNIPIQQRARSTADALKERANSAFSVKQYSLAVSLYDEAIRYCPDNAVLYSNRSTALIRRNWFGDAQLALDDAETALQLDPNYEKAYYRKILALKQLHRYSEALNFAQHTLTVFPNMDRLGELCRLLQDMVTSQTQRPNRSDSRSNGQHATPLTMTTEGIALWPFPGMAFMELGSLSSPDEQTSVDSPPDPQLYQHIVTNVRQRFVGHCNVGTDIKECAFFGFKEEFVLCGSDDGRIFVWDKKSGALLRHFAADEDVVNSIQPHPIDPVIASSGIEDAVKLWSPAAEEPLDQHNTQETFAILDDNQQRMKSDMQIPLSAVRILEESLALVHRGALHSRA
eukprot:GILJ01015260.1.p1 GENE.GILJ01015260.1~~GILJ01015260.1.p1  ORF type:complete len:668 (+),score=76.71 GILJ01015260.1:63-2006(+)